MSISQHVPVMVDEILNLLPDKLKTAIDCTAGGGGHSEALLRNSPDDLQLICIDKDSLAIKMTSERLQSFNNVRILRKSFSEIRRLSDTHTESGFDFILLDQGQSMDQILSKDRGFSFNVDAKLDMRFDNESAKTAYNVINEYSLNDLAFLLKEYGGEKQGKLIAKAIVNARPVSSTGELASIVSRVAPHRYRIKALARVFMALRIAVNDEVDELEKFLAELPGSLSVGGRAAVLSYDSLQDRPVKQSFVEGSRSCVCPPEFPVCICETKPEYKVITHKALKPTDEEINRNPSSRSARLRVVEKVN